MAYRLTQRAHELFQADSNEATIELLHAAEKLYGPAAPDKLLMIWFQAKADRYEAKVKGDTLPERAKSLAKLRDSEGCMAEFEAAEGLRIVEFHSPIGDLLRAFPIVARLEAEMFQRVLRVVVMREEEVNSGLYHCTFTLGEPLA